MNAILYGFYNRRDLLDQRVNQVNMAEINSAVDESLAEHERQLQAFMGLFVTRTTQYSERYKGVVVSRSQPLDDNGRALPIKRAGYYDVGYPLQDSGSAWGANYITLAKMTVREVNDVLATMMDGDIRWVRDHIMAALFTNASWAFTDPDHGAVTIQGLANADTVTYQTQSGADSGATDTHYLAQAASIDNSNNPFDDIYTELTEHPENGGEVVTLVPTGLLSTIEALSTFYPITDPNVQLASTSGMLTGRLSVPVPGIVRGYADKNWIVEWKSLPANYMISVPTEGERPLAMREEPEAELQGFRRVAERNDHPFYESQYLRRAGFGARNRVGAVVTRIGNASYAIPTNYGSPMR